MPPGWTACGADATVLVAAVELDGEEDVRGLRAAIGHEGFVRRGLEVGVVEVHIRELMAGRREVDETSAGREQGGDAVDEDEVTEMVGAELGFEAVSSFPEWGGHDTSIGDDDVEGLAVGDELVGCGAGTGERREVELDELEAATVRRGIFADFHRGAFGFLQVAGGADDMRSVGDEGAGGFYAQTGRDAGDQDAFAFEIYAGEDIFCGRGSAEGLCHVSNLLWELQFELLAARMVSGENLHIR